MNIPKTFTLGSVSYKVEYVPHLNREDAVALSDSDECWIKIVDSYPKKRQEQAFCHELMHILFAASGRDDLHGDETLVDVTGTFLHQYLDTKKDMA